MAGIEKIAPDRYILVTGVHSMELNAQQLLDVMDWCLLHGSGLRREAEEAQEDEDTRNYMEHHYLGGE